MKHVTLFDSLPQMSAEEFKALVEAVDDECIERGWPCCPWLPPIHEHAEES